MKKLLFTILATVIILQYAVADSVIVGTVKDSVTGSNILSGSIEFIPIDTPKTNSSGDLLFGYKTIAYINDGKFSATLTEGLYDCVIGPFNITKPITVPAGDNVINLATIYGNTDNSLVTFFQFYTLSNALASMITGSVSGVATFNGRSGAVTLTSNDVYTVDIAAEKIKFTSDSYANDTNVLAFAVLSVDNELSAATNARSLIVQSLGVDPATNAVNSITNNFATTNYVNDAVYNATNGLSTGSMDYTVTNHFATTNYVMAAMGEATDYTDSAILDFLNNTLSDAATTPIVNITNGLATIAYVNTATNNFITTANAQSLTNNFATKVYAESLTNNFATTNYVKNYIETNTVNATNLTGTIDAARLPGWAATTRQVASSIISPSPFSVAWYGSIFGQNITYNAETNVMIQLPRDITVKHLSFRWPHALGIGTNATATIRTNGTDMVSVTAYSGFVTFGTNISLGIPAGTFISWRLSANNYFGGSPAPAQILIDFE